MTTMKIHLFMNPIKKASPTGSDVTFVNPPCDSDLFTAPATSTHQVPTTSMLNDQPDKSALYDGYLQTGKIVSNATKEQSHSFNTPTASIDSYPSWAGPSPLHGEGQIDASPIAYSQHLPNAPRIENVYNQQALRNFSRPLKVVTLPALL